MRLVPNSWGSLREYNHNHDPKNGEFASGEGGSEVPDVAPGTAPIPAGMVRVYHYTGNLAGVLHSGLSTEHARGSSYGETNAIWVSTAKPGDQKDYVEFFVKPSEMVNGPDINYVRDAATGSYRRTVTDADRQLVLDAYNAGAHNSMLNVSAVPPERFVTHSTEWHHTFRHAMADPEIIAGFKSGEFDWMAGDEVHGKAFAAIKAEIARRRL